MRLILYNFNEICLISFYGVVLTIMLWDQWNKKNLSFWKEPGNVQTNSSVSLLYAALQSKLVWLILRTFSRDIFRWSPPEEVWWRLVFCWTNSMATGEFNTGSWIQNFGRLKSANILAFKNETSREIKWPLHAPKSPKFVKNSETFKFWWWLDGPDLWCFFNLALPRERPLVMFVL